MVECNINKLALIEGGLNFSSKSTSTTTANVHLMESFNQLANWLKKKHITVDEIYHLCSLLFCEF